MATSSMPAPSPRPFAATLLAAGRGERLGGRAKSSLLIDGLSVLERLVQTLREAGATEVHVVIACGSRTLRPDIERSGAHALSHVRDEADLVDSQRLAVQAHVAQHPQQDLLLMPADLPLLRAEHIRPLVQAWSDRPPQVLAQVPVVDGVRGHPVLLAWEAVQAIHEAPGSPGVREWLRAHPDLTRLLPCDDDAHVFDVDTDDDVDRLRIRLPHCELRWP